MTLGELIGPEAKLPAPWSGVAIAGLAADSRAVKPGYLFAALSGVKTEGARFIEDALQRGAAAILVPEGAARPATSLPIVEDKDPRRRLALIAARFFGLQPKVAVAVTGTNGKTSVASFVRQLWAGQGFQSGKHRYGRRGRPARHRAAQAHNAGPDRAARDPRRPRRGRRHPSCVRSFEPWLAAASLRRHRPCSRRLHQYLARPFGLSRELRGVFRPEAPPVPRAVAAGRRLRGRCRQRGRRDRRRRSESTKACARHGRARRQRASAVVGQS